MSWYTERTQTNRCLLSRVAREILLAMQEGTPLRNELPHKIGAPGTSSTTYQTFYWTSCLGTDGMKTLT